MPMKELFDSYVDDIVTAHLRRIQYENAEIHEMSEHLKEICDEIEEFMNDRDDLQELGRLLRNYDDTRNSEELINYHELYVSGVKDRRKDIVSSGFL